jgi:hypothetical protein
MPPWTWVKVPVRSDPERESVPFKVELANPDGLIVPLKVPVELMLPWTVPLVPAVVLM